MKKFLLFLLMMFSSFLISNKVSAVTDYCEFGDLKLSLPTTISVEIEGFDYNRPFDNYNKYRYSKSHYIYDRDSCITPIEIPYTYQDSNGLTFLTENYTTYCISIQFYYYYNNSRHFSFTPLVNAIYSYKDTLAPTIHLINSHIEVGMGELYNINNLLSFISVSDDTSKNIAANIIYDSYTENYNIPGKYQIIYEACDDFNNCSKAAQTMEVIDNIPPTIEGEKTIVSNMSNPLTIFQIASILKAHDNCDGDITPYIYMVNSHYNLDKPGNYYAMFSVKDSSGNEVEELFKINITYIDDIAPIIEGPTKFKSYLSNKLSTQDIISNLLVSDNVDINVNSNIYIKSDQYTNSMNVIGSYSVIISCYDKSGNESTPYIVTIDVIDNVAPSIEGPSVYTSKLSTPLTISEVKNKIIAMDNHDGNITHKVEVMEDTYSLNMDKIGVYLVSFIVKDSSNNESNIFIIEITNIDDVLPIIEGLNYHLTTTDKEIDVYSLTQSLLAKDNIDGDVSYKIELDENTYTDNYFNPGIYYLTYYVCDKSGNISLPFKIKIVVNNNLSFINSINNSILYLDTSSLIKSEEILKTLNINTNNYISILEIENTYTPNYSMIGNYKVLYEITNTDHSKEYLDIKISTYKKEERKENKKEETSSNKTKKKETIFSYIISFFKNLFLDISSNLKKLFS